MIIGKRYAKGKVTHYLVFDTGKEVILTPEEFEEFKNKIRMLRAEYKMRKKEKVDTTEWDWLR